MKKNVFLLILLACLFCGNTVVQAQVMKAADLEKYALEKGEVTDSLTSGRQEMLESVLNNIMFSL